MKTTNTTYAPPIPLFYRPNNYLARTPKTTTEMWVLVGCLHTKCQVKNELHFHNPCFSSLHPKTNQALSPDHQLSNKYLATKKNLLYSF